MIHHGRKLTGAALARLLSLAALVAALSVFVACGNAGNKNAKNVAPGDQTVQVRITDDKIEMPASLTSGKTTFEVTNAGTREHSFGITGPGGDKTLEKTLQPGEHETLDMPLDAGTYRVYCPVDQQHGDPMQIAVNVRPDTAGSKG